MSFSGLRRKLATAVRTRHSVVGTALDLRGQTIDFLLTCPLSFSFLDFAGHFDCLLQQRRLLAPLSHFIWVLQFIGLLLFLLLRLHFARDFMFKYLTRDQELIAKAAWERVCLKEHLGVT